METSNHLKKNGATPKSQMSRDLKFKNDDLFNYQRIDNVVN